LGGGDPSFGADPSGVIGTDPGLGPGDPADPGFISSLGPSIEGPGPPASITAGFPDAPAPVTDFNVAVAGLPTDLGILDIGHSPPQSPATPVMAGGFTPDASPVTTTSVTGAPAPIGAPQVSDPTDVGPPAVATGPPTDLGPGTPSAPGPTAPGVPPSDIGPGSPASPGTVADIGGGPIGTGGGVSGGDVLGRGVLGGGGPLGGILGPGAGGGIAGQEGGVELSSGQIVPELLSGQAMSPEQIVAFSQAQTALLESWSSVIDPSDPRWPQVVEMVNQQALQQISGQPALAA